MARKATGKVLERKRQNGTVYALRFTAGGERQYVTLGTAVEGWSRKRAEDELRHVMADVERGIWQPLKPGPAQVIERDPTFHEFASEWFEAHRGEWREATRLDYEWQLSKHLLKHFGHHRLSQITVVEVDRYRTAKVGQGKLSAASINKTLTRLAQILEVAVEYGHIERNPATGKRRRVKAARPAAVWLDSAEHIEALLDAAGELDREARADQRVPRRAILSALVFSGLRIGELIDLRWRDVNLADGRITVRASKTDAGVRRVDLLPVLADVLGTHKASTRAGSDQRVFPTLAGGPLNPSNVRNRILTRAAERASERLEAVGATPLPEGLTPHKLRHTFASLLVALGTDAGAVMDQLGHTDPGFTLRVYRHGMRRDQESRARLRELVGAVEVAPIGSSGQIEGQTVPIESNGNPAKTIY